MWGKQGLRKYKYKDKHKENTKTYTKTNTRTTDRPMMLCIFGKEMTKGV